MTFPPTEIVGLRQLKNRRDRASMYDEIVVDFPEGVDYLGSYDSIPAYLRAMLEPEVTPACAWILDHLDYPAVLRRWESDGSRLVIERGHVYRLAEELVARMGPSVAAVETTSEDK